MFYNKEGISIVKKICFKKLLKSPILFVNVEYF